MSQGCWYWELVLHLKSTKCSLLPVWRDTVCLSESVCTCSEWLCSLCIMIEHLGHSGRNNTFFCNIWSPHRVAEQMHYSRSAEWSIPLAETHRTVCLTRRTNQTSPVVPGAQPFLHLADVTQSLATRNRGHICCQ